MFSIIKNDITILYQGSSGGFLLYYLILLERKDPKLVWDQIYKQFPEHLKYDRSTWKETELWPDNNSDVRLICNPFFCKEMDEHNKLTAKDTFVILLFTDLKTQLRLAYDKSSYWFTDVSKKQFNAPNNNITYIRRIISTHTTYEGTIVDPMVPRIIEEYNPIILFKLQDILDKQYMFNEEQQKFIKYWLSLQSNKSLRYLIDDI